VRFLKAVDHVHKIAISGAEIDKTQTDESYPGDHELPKAVCIDPDVDVCAASPGIGPECPAACVIDWLKTPSAK
jgi:hypothetical protein